MDIRQDFTGDMMMENGDFALAPPVRAAAEQCLKVNRRAANVEEAGDGNLRGWFGNSELGSLLWTLVGRNATSSLLRTAEGYARDSLRFLVDAGLVQRVEAEAVNDKGVVNLSVRLILADGVEEITLADITGAAEV